MAKVNKEELTLDISSKIFQNYTEIRYKYLKQMEQCFEPIDFMKLSAYCAIKFLKHFTINTNKQIIIELANMFEEMKQNILKEQNHVEE